MHASRHYYDTRNSSKVSLHQDHCFPIRLCLIHQHDPDPPTPTQFDTTAEHASPVFASDAHTCSVSFSLSFFVRDPPMPQHKSSKPPYPPALTSIPVTARCSDSDPPFPASTVHHVRTLGILRGPPGSVPAAVLSGDW